MPALLPSLAHPRGGLLAVALTLVCGAGASRAMAQVEAGGPDPEGIADQVRRRGDYADRLPVAASENLGSDTRIFGGGASGGGGSGAGDRALGGDDDDDPAAPAEERSASERRSSSRGGAPAALPVAGGSSIVLWLGIAVLVGVLVFVLASLRPKAGALAQAPPRRGDVDAPAAPPGLTVVAGDPDELARAGRYEDAIAALLLAALREVGWRPEGLMRSRTAREILASVGPGDARYAPLSELVSIQERVAFGGDEATEARWAAATRHYRLLIGAEGSA